MTILLVVLVDPEVARLMTILQESNLLELPP